MSMKASTERRLNKILSQLPQNKVLDEPCINKVIRNDPRKIEKIRWNGWGYADTEFTIQDGQSVYLSGSRYLFSGHEMPHIREFVERMMGVPLEVTSPSRPPPTSFPAPIENVEFLEDIDGFYVNISFDGMDRLHHSHGHTAQEIYDLRYGHATENRLPDVVIYPGKHNHVVKIVEAAHLHNVVIIPFGGGTSVSDALRPMMDEQRMVVSLDMHEMDRVKWVDSENLVACIEAGVVGVDLVKKLEEIGFTMGHEPDSLEFSTLGGWIATRASGMKKNVYGNIEDLIISAKVVTPLGVMEQSVQVPRISSGPSLNNIIIGSEGTFGVVTEALVKIFPLPEARVFGAIVFPNFESGVKFMRDVAYHHAQPASIRLVDPEQFQFGQALKPGTEGLWNKFVDKAKKFYVTKYHGFNGEDLSAVTLLFEGSHDSVKQQTKMVYSLAKKHGGVKADAENGKRGYQLTFMIAYIRDLAFSIGIMAESFETSVPWSKTFTLCTRVKQRIRQSCRNLKIPGEPFVSCRVTQTYDVGSCVYFYFGIQFQGINDPVGKFSQIEHEAREEIISCGGSISHHHGVGKHRKDFLPQMIGETGVETLRGIKNTLDPKNIFANGNLV